MDKDFCDDDDDDRDEYASEICCVGHSRVKCSAHMTPVNPLAPNPQNKQKLRERENNSSSIFRISSLLISIININPGVVPL